MEISSLDGPRITRVILYVRDIAGVAAFYQSFFQMRPLPGAGDGWLELGSSSDVCTIALHQASVAQRSGAAMKLVFGVADVRAVKNTAEQQGLKFGAVHAVEDFEFANAKDPAGNSIQISSRVLKKSV